MIVRTIMQYKVSLTEQQCDLIYYCLEQQHVQFDNKEMSEYERIIDIFHSVKYPPDNNIQWVVK